MKKFFGVALTSTGKTLNHSTGFDHRKEAEGWAAQLLGNNATIDKVFITESVAIAERQNAPIKVTPIIVPDISGTEEELTHHSV